MVLAPIINRFTTDFSKVAKPKKVEKPEKETSFVAKDSLGENYDFGTPKTGKSQIPGVPTSSLIVSKMGLKVPFLQKAPLYVIG